MDDKKPDEVASVLEEMHNAGKGIVGMKILGEGRIKTPERKDASLRYVLGLGTVNAFIIGFESPEQVDDLLKRTADAIAFLKVLIHPRTTGVFSLLPREKVPRILTFAFSLWNLLPPGRCRAAADEGPADGRKQPCGEGHPLALPVPVPSRRLSRAPPIGFDRRRHETNPSDADA